MLSYSQIKFSYAFKLKLEKSKDHTISARRVINLLVETFFGFGRLDLLPKK